MMRVLQADDLPQWREQARALLAHGTTPLDVTWAEHAQPALFTDASLPLAPPNFRFNVPKGFMRIAEVVACHRDARRWDLLYQLLFRLYAGEKDLLRIATDPLINALELMQKAVRRDAHKAKAFVRFRLVEAEGTEHYIAWHQPDHRVLPLVAPFFSRRFSSMVWTVLTPDKSVHWDGHALHWGPGVRAEEAPQADVLENLWRDYYRATFNPARIKIRMMKREMPVRYWKNLPETDIIHSMLAQAPERVEKMIRHQQAMQRSADDYLPVQRDIAMLRSAAHGCQGCELYQHAHQVVFGQGPVDARLMLVGEQPGSDEDQHGVPFVGPAGQLLDETLSAVGLRREDIYITNAVKHFRFLYRDSFRQHQTPSRYHVQACKPWLTAEIAAVKPQLVICLGNTAARALISPNFVMKDGRGRPVGSAPTLFATYHPSALLRAPKEMRDTMREAFTQDMRTAMDVLEMMAA